jgi:hypothetical protein
LVPIPRSRGCKPLWRILFVWGEGLTVVCGTYTKPEKEKGYLSRGHYLT